MKNWLIYNIKYDELVNELCIFVEQLEGVAQNSISLDQLADCTKEKTDVGHLSLREV